MRNKEFLLHTVLPLALTMIFLGVVFIFYAPFVFGWDKTPVVGRTFYFTRDTNTSGGLDTNNSGIQYDTIFESQTMMNISGSDRARFIYTVDARQATDHRCSVWTTLYWGSRDTMRTINKATVTDVTYGIDSTYDSMYVVAENILDGDSLQYLENLGIRMIIGMHVWDDNDTNSAGRLVERQTPVRLHRALFLDNE